MMMQDLHAASIEELRAVITHAWECIFDKREAERAWMMKAKGDAATKPAAPSASTSGIGSGTKLKDGIRPHRTQAVGATRSGVATRSYPSSSFEKKR